MFKDINLFAHPDLRISLIEVGIQLIKRTCIPNIPPLVDSFDSIIATAGVSDLWDRINNLKCDDQKVVWQLQSAFIQTWLPSPDSPLLELLKNQNLSKYFKWYIEQRKDKGARLGKEFPDLEQLRNRISDTYASMLDGTVLMEEVEVVFMDSTPKKNNDSSATLDTTKRMLEYLICCECSPNLGRFHQVGHDLRELRTDISSILLLSHFTTFV